MINNLSQEFFMEIKQAIRQFITENFLFSTDEFPFDDDASFLEEGVIDSTGTLELVIFLEETFGFEVEDHEIEPDNFDSINKLAAYIARKGVGDAARP
ncbi:MAG: acyl carrier protein [Candidatus Promineifilaceae bacterium]